MHAQPRYILNTWAAQVRGRSLAALFGAYTCEDMVRITAAQTQSPIP